MELKEELRNRGLAVSGVKANLIKRGRNEGPLPSLQKLHQKELLTKGLLMSMMGPAMMVVVKIQIKLKGSLRQLLVQKMVMI